MAKPKYIELAEGGIVIPILYEDRSVMAVDKPAGWLLAPDSWDQTGRNLQLALQSSLNAGDFWARSRSLKYLRFIHRLDAETTGVLLLAKSPGALTAFSALFETRSMEKRYFALVHGIPKEDQWICGLALMPDPRQIGRMQVVPPNQRPPARGDGWAGQSRDDRGQRADAPKDAETHFRVLQKLGKTALVEAHPVTGRTHQIRVHLAASGHPVVGDPVYGSDAAAASKGRQDVALRAVRLEYMDPFQKRRIYVEAPVEEFVRKYGFDPAAIKGREGGKSKGNSPAIPPVLRPPDSGT